MEIARHAVRQNRHGAGGDTQTAQEEFEEALHAFGFAPPESDSGGDDEDGDVCEVWEENWPALQLFLACQSQWVLHIGGMGGGVTTAAASCNVAQELAWQSVKPRHQKQVVAQYRVMEAEALRILNERVAARSSA